MPGTPPPSSASAADRRADALPPGTRLGEFEVLSVLGAGGFGMVYRAFDHSLLRPVAIKEYLPTALAHRTGDQSLWVRSSSDEPSFQAGLASFVEEARLLAQFDHPSLAKVFRFWEAHQTAYMVMPLYEGMTLKQARARMTAPPPEAWLRQVLWAVLGALRELHGAHTLHRDISPDNIFLQDRGPPVLLDLGAARKAMGRSISSRHAPATVLTASYAPIEQYPRADSDLPQGPWSDLYALGAVVHGCLSNASPLPATLRAVRDRMVPFAQVVRTARRESGTHYSPAFVAAVSQALALRPEDRPESIDEFLRAMEMTEAPEGAGLFEFRAALGPVWSGPDADPAGGGEAPQTPAPAAPPQAGAACPVRQLLADDLSVAARASHPAPSALSTAFTHLRATAGPRGGRAGRRPRWAAAPWMLAGTAALLVAGTGGAWWQLQHRLEALRPDGLAAGWGAHTVAALAPADPSPLLQIADERGLPPPRAESGPVRHGGAAQARPSPRPPPEGPRAVAAAPAALERPSARAGRSAPQQICAGAGFLARPMCVHRECQKAEHAARPVCVQARRHRAEEERRQKLLAPQ